MNRSEHYSVIKIFVPLLVVLGHAARMYTGAGVVTPAVPSAFLARLSEILYSFHMALFMTVTGAVYSYCRENGKYRSPLELIRKKTVRLFVPYLFIGLLNVAPVMCLLGFTEESYPAYCLHGILLVGNSRHLWFVFVLFLIFLLCAPLGDKLGKINFYLAAAVLFVCALLSPHLPTVFQIGNLFYYALFFFLGYRADRVYDRVIRVLGKPYVLLLLFAVWAVLSAVNRTFAIILRAAAGTALFAGLTSFLPGKLPKNPILARAGKNGFGIYLFHPMILYVLFDLLGAYPIPAPVLCFGVTAASYLLSFALTELFRAIGCGFVIGEPMKKEHRNNRAQ